MKYLTLLLLLVNYVSYSQIKSNKDYICWKEGVKLRWSDFRCRESKLNNDDSTFTNSANAAPELSVQGITSHNGKNNFIVKVVFNRNRAWIRDSSKATPKLLNHEQLHFNIAELVARRLRQKIEQARNEEVDIFSSAFGKKIRYLLHEQVVIDNLYDAQTIHGIVDEQQNKWQNYINSELHKLDKYQSTINDCN